MGKCFLCGLNAGLFRVKHSACATRAEKVKSVCVQLVAQDIDDAEAFAEHQRTTETLISGTGFPYSFFQEDLLNAASQAVMKYAQQSPVSKEERDRCYKILDDYGCPVLSEDTKDFILDRKLFGRQYIDMSYVIGETIAGRYMFFNNTSGVRFNILPNEAPIFSADNVMLAEEKTVHTGGRIYGGMSVPIGAGMRYYAGSSHSQSVSGLVPIEEGQILITNHAIYFGGRQITFELA